MKSSQDNEVRYLEMDGPMDGSVPPAVPASPQPLSPCQCDVCKATLAVAPVSEPAPSLPPPSPIDDFERRLKLCHEHGVRALKDGQLEVVFSPPPRKQTPEEAGLSAFVMAEAAANMKAGE